MTAHLGAVKATIDDQAVRLTSLSGTSHDVRCITTIEVPPPNSLKEHLAPGDQISLACDSRSGVSHGWSN
jgi:hypothetical protein